MNRNSNSALATEDATQDGANLEQASRAANRASETGTLVVNADDWGKDRATTDRIFDCIKSRAVSAASAMVFMEDSERAAGIATESAIDAGLHLNLSAPFTAVNLPTALAEHHRRVTQYVGRHALARVFYNPFLVNSFEYVVKAQLEEYHRLYGAVPVRIDGHHHLHLCANVQRDRLLPAGTLARRNFSFQMGEKSWFNRSYRARVDRRLARRHRVMDFLFLLPPLESSRLQRIFSLAASSAVEVETHPANADEYKFLTGGEMLRQAGDIPIAARFPQASDSLR
jgi:chitin disaccharide deacetylase